MIDVVIKGLVKAFEEGENILDGLSFEVHAGERVGILGRNGCGKTTLFRLMTGELRPDEGEIMIAPGKRMGLISQIPVYPEGYTTEDVLRSAHDRLYAMERRMEELTQKMAGDASEQTLREYDRIAAEFQRLGGYDMEVERNRVANGLEIPETMRRQLFSNLSGGEKTRVNLARLILEDTDILLLDEPTNHLDMRATEWLESYLLKFKGTVLTISHDRYFLDVVAQRTIEITEGKAQFYSGNYSFYVQEKQRRLEEQLRKYEKEQKELKRLDEAAQRLYQWGTGNAKLMRKSFAIRSRMERIQTTARPEREKRMRTAFKQREFFGDEVLVLDQLKKSYGERTLFDDVSLEVTGGERIALIGDNGTGKSTLIKLIMREQEPDAGIVYQGPSVKTAYLPQLVSFEDPRRSILDTMLYEAKVSPQEARNRLGAFLFSGDDVFKPVATLSGGEQSRLRLCILMREEINFLILDEPTNHLDLISREWMEGALSDYEEALLFVSHDRYFIQKFATRIWELKDGKIFDYPGTFEAYRQFPERQHQLEMQKPSKQDVKKTQKKPKLQANTEKRAAKLEREIAKLEAQIAQCDADAETFSTDYEKLIEIESNRQELDAALDRLYEEWGELTQ
jgi:ATP-binding cassette subfamily F protein 3